MSSVSASHLVLFIASLIVAVGMAGTVVFQVSQMSTAIETQGSTVTQEIETDIAIISDPARSDAIYDAGSNEVTVLVKNIGSESVPADPKAVEVLVNGRYITNDQLAVTRVDTTNTSWRPGGVVEITISGQDLSGDIEVAVIVNNNEDAINFNV